MADVAVDISVVVPAFQAAATISRCVAALFAQSLPRERYEVIVVDDASTDDTARRALQAGARVVRTTRNLGPGGCRNVGVAMAHGAIVVFTDADCEPTSTFLVALTSLLDDPRVGGAKGVYLSRQRSLVARFVQLEYEQRYRRAAKQASLDFADTYACCYRRADLIRVGGFDARLRTCEDQDLSFRLADQGVRIVFAAGARTYHLHCEHWGRYVCKKFRIARWKTRVLRRDPRKALHDSHTPQTLKLQIPLSYAICLAIAVRILDRQHAHSWRPLVAAVSGYLALISPFVATCVRRDLPVACIAPALLFSRDLALGAGLARGWLTAVEDA